MEPRIAKWPARALANGMIFMIILSGLIANASIALPRFSDQAVGEALVVAPPWVDRDAVIRTTGATPLGLPAAFATVAVVVRPGMAAAMRAQAPVLLLDLDALKTLCGLKV